MTALIPVSGYTRSYSNNHINKGRMYSRVRTLLFRYLQPAMACSAAFSAYLISHLVLIALSRTVPALLAAIAQWRIK